MCSKYHIPRLFLSLNSVSLARDGTLYEVDVRKHAICFSACDHSLSRLVLSRSYSLQGIAELVLCTMLEEIMLSNISVRESRAEKRERQSRPNVLIQSMLI